ncbi:DNA-binding protein YbiB [Pseudaquabacterium rugosum]|uniref:DNA-binding protein YbiB n=1 Tax=Pseudaquabacterium rugosum TaxID=2984194 RepID=A0ABU9B8P0_9BURK
MSIAPYLKEIGRGAEGARALDAAQAEDLFAQVLDRRCSDLEIGAFALAMRVKGETCEELAGFQQATHARCVPLPTDRPTVVIPSYNGARRLPNFTPLLALHLARQGAQVLVHGPLRDPQRVSTAEIFEALALPPATGADAADAVQRAWAAGQPAFIDTAALCPPLQGLLDVRRVVGLRNSGHTIAKLLQPVSGAPALRLASHTHPEFGLLMAALAERTGADLMLLRGTEGEAVADPRRCPKLETWIGGQRVEPLGCPAQEGPLATLPVLPAAIDAATTAAHIQAVMAGHVPLPAPIETQARLLLEALRHGRPAA